MLAKSEEGSSGDEQQEQNLIAALRTGNTPVQIAVTRNNRYLIVTNDHSQLARVFDLETLEPSRPIVFPPGHYPRSVAVSNRSILAAVRSPWDPTKSTSCISTGSPQAGLPRRS